MKNFRKFIYAICTLSLFYGCTIDDPDNNGPAALNNLTLGASANDLLSDQKYTSLKLELVYVRDYAPSATTISAIKHFLETYTHKPDGIEIVTKEINSPGKEIYSVKEDIVQLEKEHRSVFTNGSELAVFIFFVDGKSSSQEENKLVLGTAYKNTSMAIFEQTIRNLAKSSNIARSEIETTTIEHEFGHLFGLVDNGSPAQSAHEDIESKNHCSTTNCLMVASVEFGTGALALLKSGHTRKFDDSCLLDLRANGGR